MSDYNNTILTQFYINGVEVKGIDLDTIPIPDGNTDSRIVSTQENVYVHKRSLGMYDPGECEISGFYIPGDPGQAALDTAFRSRAECTFQVHMVESGTIFEYPGKILKFIPQSEENTAKFIVKILATGLFEGNTTYATVSKIEATYGIITPTIGTTLSDSDNVLIIVEPAGNSTDAIKITASAANEIKYSLDGGTTWLLLTSGVYSSDVLLNSTGDVTRILVKITEKNTATRFITMYITNSVWDKLNTSSGSMIIEKQLVPPPNFNFGFDLPNFYIGSDGVHSPEFYSDCDIESLQPQGKTYYVDVENGSSSNDGLTAETPFGLLEDAIEKTDGDVIVLAPGIYSHVLTGNGYWKSSPGTLPHSMSVICPNGRAIISQRQSFSSDVWDLVSGKSHTYMVSRTNAGRVFDSSVLDAHGDYTELTHVTSIDSVEATAKSWYTDGSNVYVHTADGGIPDEQIYVFFKVLKGLQVANTYTYYFENIDIEGGSSPFQLSHGNIYAKNCTFKYGTDNNGISLLGSNAIFINCTAANNAMDGFNYHISTFGRLCYGIEIGCVGRDNGGLLWVNSNKIDNGSTAHDGCMIVRCNCNYLRNYGPNCIDITGTKSWNINCATTDTKVGSDTSSANAGFECKSGAIMWLDSCTATGTYYATYVEDSDGTEMYYTNSRIAFIGI